MGNERHTAPSVAVDDLTNAEDEQVDKTQGVCGSFTSTSLMQVWSLKLTTSPSESAESERRRDNRQ